MSTRRKDTSDLGQWWSIGECDDDDRSFLLISCRWREKGYWMLVYHQTLANVMMVSVIFQWSHLDEEKKDIGCWWMIKDCGICASGEKLFNNLISMKRKKTSDVGEWSNVGECVHGGRNSSMISSRWREKGHRMFVNGERLLWYFVLGVVRYLLCVLYLLRFCV